MAMMPDGVHRLVRSVPQALLHEISTKYSVDFLLGTVRGKRGCLVGTNKGGTSRIVKVAVTVRINGKIKQFTLPRGHIIWFAATGEWPQYPVGHKNGNAADDRFDNLFLYDPSS